MSTTKISQLPSDSNPSTTDYVPALDTETTSTRKITLANILSLFFNNIPSSVVTNASLKTGAGEPGGAWDSWTPTWTNLTVGNGTVSAYYKQIGKTVHFRVQFVLGTTSAMGTAPVFTLPVTANLTGITTSGFSANTIGTGSAQDNSTSGGYQIGTSLASSTTAGWLVMNTTFTYPATQGISSTVPMTWATSDILYAEGTYEAA